MVAPSRSWHGSRPAAQARGERGGHARPLRQFPDSPLEPENRFRRNAPCLDYV